MLALSAAVLSACQSSSPAQGPKPDARYAARGIGEAQVRSDLMDFLRRFEGKVSWASDRIQRASTDPGIRRRAILWRDRAKAQDAAKAMKITAADAMRLGAIDEVLQEPTGGAHRDFGAVADTIRTRILSDLTELEQLPTRDLLDQRLEKFLSMGIFEDNTGQNQ